MSNRDTEMELDRLILRTAFRHRIKEPDLASGQARFEAITGSTVDGDAFARAVGRLLTAGLIHDPVRLPPGALQCHWRLEVTPEGFAAVGADSIRTSLESAGVEFIAENGGGAGVRLRKPNI